MARSSSFPTPWGVLLALAVGLYACRSREGERCICADDCREGLNCVSDGRVLQAGECTPVAGPGSSPGLCVDEDEAGIDDEGGELPDVFMDLGSRRDFDPGAPPDPEPETDTDALTSGSGSSGSSNGTSSGGSSSDSGGSSSGGSSSGGSSSDGGSSSGGSSGTTGGTTTGD